MFILSLPTNLPAKEVISRAKTKGMVTTGKNVSRLRKLSGGKSTGLSKSEFMRQQPASLPAIGAGPSSMSKVEALLHAIAGV